MSQNCGLFSFTSLGYFSLLKDVSGEIFDMRPNDRHTGALGINAAW
jgi:hypothetical protein